MMSDKSKNCGCVQNVGCNVKDCKYHSSLDLCSARQITVQNEAAQRKSETFCATFESRATL